MLKSVLDFVAAVRREIPDIVRTSSSSICKPAYAMQRQIDFARSPTRTRTQPI